MMKFLSIVLLVAAASCDIQQKFVYLSNETFIIQEESMIEVTMSLTTEADEYLSEANIFTIFYISQQNTSILYNLIFFSYQNSSGQQCYQNWILSNVPIPTTDCHTYNFQESMLPDCMNFTGCKAEEIQFSLNLGEEEYEESFFIFQNPSNDTQLILNASLQMQLSSQNTWFYWGVGLTCLLLISLVIYAGIIFYWMLKYKKVKKMFEQFKLTEEEESIKKDN